MANHPLIISRVDEHLTSRCGASKDGADGAISLDPRTHNADMHRPGEGRHRRSCDEVCSAFEWKYHNGEFQHPVLSRDTCNDWHASLTISLPHLQLPHRLTEVSATNESGLAQVVHVESRSNIHAPSPACRRFHAVGVSNKSVGASQHEAMGETLIS